jgi:hypothetical protein
MQFTANSLSLRYRVTSIIGAILTGTISTFVNRTLFSYSFKRQWFMTALMFLGEVLCLVVYGISGFFDRFSDPPLIVRLTPVDSPASDLPIPPYTNWQLFRWSFAPTFCDLFSSTASSLSLPYMPSSIWQILRCSSILVTLFFLVFVSLNVLIILICGFPPALFS